MATITDARMTNPTAMEDSLYEIVRGEVVESPTMGSYEVSVANLLAYLMEPFARQHRLGRTWTEILFQIDAEAQTARRPDLAFISAARWPLDSPVPRENAWPVIPDLAVEIVSPGNSADEIATKVDEYFRAGVRRVWVIYPKIPRLYDFQSPRINQGYDLNDPVDGGDILPGFSFRLADILGS